ncbi:hypothetical protein Tco_0776456 [Tanacetum coccineum]
MREDIEKLKDKIRNAAIVDNETEMVINHGENQRQNMQFTRVTKIEFPKFGGEDVKGWILLSSVEISQEQANSFYIVVLPNDIELAKLQGEIFSTSVMFLPLGGCDMMLGFQWLSTLADIKFNFQDLKMAFAYKGKCMTLRGSTKPVVQWRNDDLAGDPTQAANGYGMPEVPSILDYLVSAIGTKVNAASMKVTTAERLQLLEEFLLSEG